MPVERIGAGNAWDLRHRLAFRARTRLEPDRVALLARGRPGDAVWAARSRRAVRRRHGGRLHFSFGGRWHRGRPLSVDVDI